MNLSNSHSICFGKSSKTMWGRRRGTACRARISFLGEACLALKQVRFLGIYWSELFISLIKLM